MIVHAPVGDDADPRVRAKTREAILRLKEMFEEVADQLEAKTQKGGAT